MTHMAIRLQHADSGGYVLRGGIDDADDAASTTAWDGDFCVAVIERQQRERANQHAGREFWAITGGDGNWTRHADTKFSSRDDALAALLADDEWHYIDAACGDDECRATRNLYGYGN